MIGTGNVHRETPISAYQESVLARLDHDSILLEPGYMARWPDGVAVRMDALEKLKRWGLIEVEDGNVRKTK